MIEQMRADFPDAAKWEEWSAEDQAEIGAEIRAALEANDAEALAYWAEELARAAGEWRSFGARVRAAEERMKTTAKKARAG